MIQSDKFFIHSYSLTHILSLTQDEWHAAPSTEDDDIRDWDF